jgi:hypothetical protein
MGRVEDGDFIHFLKIKIPSESSILLLLTQEDFKRQDKYQSSN